jgi:transcription antitermination protein NusB
VTARTKARKKALDILFESDVRTRPALDVLAERRSQAETALNPYTIDIVEGVVANAENIDSLLQQYAHGWTIDRMPAVDRNLLRIGVWELQLSADVPDGVAIAEAVALAADLSTDESPSFINGVLSRIRELPKSP